MGNPHPERANLRFADFEADFRAGELRKGGVKLSLQEQPLQILQMLLEHPGQVVTRDELRHKIWPRNTFVDFEQGLYNSVRRLRDALCDSAENPRFIETLSRRGYRFIGAIEASPRQIQSLAVLPLENLSRDPQQEYFADGMTEALITTLAKIGALRIVSRTSAMQYKGVHRPVGEIAQELGVDGIIEGTVLRSGDRVRISAQLVHASTDTHLWAENYDRDLRDVLGLQSEVAQAIAREVEVKLTPQEQAHFAQVRRVDGEAYEAYLRGRYHWHRRPGELGQAIRYFELAIAKDPTYAAPQAGLADAFTSLSAWGLVAARDGSDKARALARNAVELDPSLAEAHSALAYATLYDYDFSGAERGFERAIELNPRYATAHQIFGFYLGATGRYEEAYTELQRALRLDPHSSLINAFVGYVYLYGRRYDKAIEQFQKTLLLDPGSGPAHAGLGWAQSYVSLYEPALASFRRGCELWPSATPLAWSGETYARAGNREEAHNVLKRLQQLSQQRYVTPYGVARVYAALSQDDEALSWLETAYQQRAEWMVLLKVDACFDHLRSDARFQSLMLRMNFPVIGDGPSQ